MESDYEILLPLKYRFEGLSLLSSSSSSSSASTEPKTSMKLIDDLMNAQLAEARSQLNWNFPVELLSTIQLHDVYTSHSSRSTLWNRMQSAVTFANVVWFFATLLGVVSLSILLLAFCKKLLTRLFVAVLQIVFALTNVPLLFEILAYSFLAQRIVHVYFAYEHDLRSVDPMRRSIPQFMALGWFFGFPLLLLAFAKLRQLLGNAVGSRELQLLLRFCMLLWAVFSGVMTYAFVSPYMGFVFAALVFYELGFSVLPFFGGFAFIIAEDSMLRITFASALCALSAMVARVWMHSTQVHVHHHTTGKEYAAARLSQSMREAMLDAYEPGLVFFGSFVLLLALLIQSSRGYYSASKPYAMYWMSNLAFVCSAGGLFAAGMFLNVGIMVPIASTYFALWLISKPLDLPTRGKGGFWLKMFGVSAVLWVVSYVVRQHPEYFHSSSMR
jgi:hypothetical protein